MKSAWYNSWSTMDTQSTIEKLVPFLSFPIYDVKFQTFKIQERWTTGSGLIWWTEDVRMSADIFLER